VDRPVSKALLRPRRMTWQVSGSLYLATWSTPLIVSYPNVIVRGETQAIRMFASDVLVDGQMLYRDRSFWTARRWTARFLLESSNGQTTDLEQMNRVDCRCDDELRECLGRFRFRISPAPLLWKLILRLTDDPEQPGTPDYQNLMVQAAILPQRELLDPTGPEGWQPSGAHRV